MFQFQIGTIGSIDGNHRKEAAQSCFNSRLVRLVDQIHLNIIGFSNVSIPDWYDW